MTLTLLELQSHIGDRQVIFYVVCPQNRTTVLKGLKKRHVEPKNTPVRYIHKRRFPRVYHTYQLVSYLANQRSANSRGPRQRKPGGIARARREATYCGGKATQDEATRDKIRQATARVDRWMVDGGDRRIVSRHVMLEVRRHHYGS